LDFGFWIADFGFADTRQQLHIRKGRLPIQNPKSKIAAASSQTVFSKIPLADMVSVDGLIPKTYEGLR
jgi:hypothetical protein